MCPWVHHTNISGVCFLEKKNKFSQKESSWKTLKFCFGHPVGVKIQQPGLVGFRTGKNNQTPCLQTNKTHKWIFIHIRGTKCICVSFDPHFLTKHSNTSSRKVQQQSKKAKFAYQLLYSFFRIDKHRLLDAPEFRCCSPKYHE